MIHQQKCCIVDDIISHRQNSQGRYQFLIKWKRSSPTWQPLDNLQAINDLITKYFAKRKVNYDQWNKTKFKDQLSSINQNNHIVQGNYFNEINKNKSLNSLQSGHSLILKFDDYFKNSLRYQKKFIKKHTQSAQCVFQVKKGIQFQKIQRAICLKKNFPSNKWVVLVQFYTCQQKLWIDRDMLRITNPFVLLQLYQRMERQQIIKQSQTIQSGQSDSIDNSQRFIQIQDVDTDVEHYQQGMFAIQIEE